MGAENDKLIGSNNAKIKYSAKFQIYGTSVYMAYKSVL